MLPQLTDPPPATFRRLATSPPGPPPASGPAGAGLARTGAAPDRPAPESYPSAGPAAPGDPGGVAAPRRLERNVLPVAHESEARERRPP